MVLTLIGEHEPADSGEPAPTEPTVPQDSSDNTNDGGVVTPEPDGPSTGTTAPAPDPQEGGTATTFEPDATPEDSCKPGEALVDGTCSLCAEGTFSAGARICANSGPRAQLTATK